MPAPRLNLMLSALILALALPHAVIGQAQHPRQRPKAVAVAPEESPWLEWQVRLDRAGFSPGEIDGVEGANTHRALEAYARAKQLAASNLTAVRDALRQDAVEVLMTYVIRE